MDNGFKKDIINSMMKQTNQLYEQVLHQIAETNKNTTAIIQQQAELVKQREATKKTKIEQIAKILLQIFGTGGMLYMVVDKIIN